MQPMLFKSLKFSYCMNRIYLKHFLLTLVINVLLTHTKAQTNDSIRLWTIQECLHYAGEHNIQIQTLRLTAASREQDLLASKGYMIPDLSASLNNTFIQTTNPASTSDYSKQAVSSNASYSLNAGMILWNDHLLRNTIEQRKLLIESAELSVKQSTNEVSFQIIQAFLNILLNKENLIYIIDLLQTSDARVKQGQYLFDAGSIAKKDLLQLQAQYAADNYLLIQTKNALRQHILALKQLLQLPADSAFEIATTMKTDYTSGLKPLHEIQLTAYQTFPEIKIGQLGLKVASLDILKLKAGYKPILSFSGSIGSNYSRSMFNTSLVESNYFNQTNNHFYQQSGLSLSVPIFSNQANRTNVYKAKLAYRTAALTLQNNELILSQAVEMAYLNAINAEQALEAAKEQMLSAKESYRIVNEQFKLGGTNSFDVLQQRNQYVQAMQEFTQAKYTAILQQKIVDFYLGNMITL